MSLEAKLAHRPPTNIPLITPRTSLPGSQPSLIPSSRKPSNGTSPRSALPTASLATSTPASANPTFRTLRSLLPFGPAKPPTSTTGSVAANAVAPKGTFLTFGSVRRSMTGERKNSISQSRPQEASESPVISIHPSSSHIPNLKLHVEQPKPVSRDTSFRPLTFAPSEPFIPPGSDALVLLPPSPLFPLSADLSTITEADTSGISKHVPPLEDSDPSESDAKDRLVDLNLSPSVSTPSDSDNHNVSPLQSRPGESEVDDGEGSPDDRNDSTFNLSTSKLKAEVLDAMMANDCENASEWLNGANVIVVDEVDQDGAADDSRESPSYDPASGEVDRSISFNLGELDPDLAALLSPNRIVKNDITITKSHHHSSRSVDLTRETTPTTSTSQRPSRIPSPQAIKLESSPVRSTFSTSKATSRVQSSTFPRFRSVSGHSTPLRANKDLPLLPPVSISNPGSPNQDEEAHRSSTDNLRQRRQPLVTPSVSSLPSGTPSSKPPSSRLATPSRYAFYGGVGIKHPRPRQTLVASPPAWDMSSTSPSSPASSSIGKATTTTNTTSTDPRHLHGLRPSLDSSESRTDISGRARLLRSRKRSMSLEDHRISPRSLTSTSLQQTWSSSTAMRPSSSLSNVRPTPEWLGRGSAAKGSLDLDREVPGRSVSRSARGGPDREYARSNRAPSRMAHSEASGSNASWARSGGASFTHTTGVSPETGSSRVVESPTVSSVAPRTTFSRGSTADTSVSGVSLSSAQQQRMQVAMQSLKERHDLETEALLSALSDSQRVAKMLREENSELRKQILEMEDRLEVALRQIEQQKAASVAAAIIPPPNHTSSSLTYPAPRSSYDFRTRTGSADDTERHYTPRLQSSTSFTGTQAHPSSYKTKPREVQHRESVSALPSATTYDLAAKTTEIKRLSVASSVFPTPPSNMAMLMAEEGAASLVADRSSAFSTGSISPPLFPPPLLPKSNGVLSRPLSTSTRTRHRLNRSMSSAGEVSPTNFSMTEAPGSPGSLCLRPEHEMHLGDMVSLDLEYHGDEGDGE